MMQLTKYMACLAVVLVLCAAAPLQAEFVHEGGNMGVIDRVYIQRGSPHDPGMLVAVLHNTRDAPVEIGTIEINGHALQQWPGADNPVAWHRITDRRLAPDETGLLQAKFIQPLQGVIRLGIQLNDRTQHVLLSASTVESVRIVAVRYGPDGQRLNVFLENAGSEPQTLNAIQLRGHEVWRPAADAMTLEAKELAVARIELDEPLAAGERLLLELHMSDRIVATTDRAVPGFRLSIESGDQEMAKRLHADPLVLESFQFTKQATEQAPAEREAAPSLAKRQGEHWSIVRQLHEDQLAERESDLACVFACPTHATDSYQTAAYLSMRAQNQVEGDGAWQSFIHACRTQPRRGIAVFGPVADAVRFNAQLEKAAPGQTDDRDQVPWTVYNLTRYAARVASPSKALPMIPLERDPSLFEHRAPLAVEARQMIYASIAAGAGGIAYRVMPQDWRDERRDLMLDQVKRTNDEIRQVRDLLAMAFPRDLVSCDDPAIQVASLDASPKGLVLVVINHDVQRAPPEMPPSVTTQPHEDVAIELTLPRGFTPGEVVSLHGATEEPFETVTWENGKGRFTLDVEGAAQMLLIKSKAGEG